MKKILVAVVAIAIVLTWNFTALSQRAEETQDESATENETVQNGEQDQLIKQFIIQQQDSRENLRRLAEGQIKSLQFGQPDQASKQVPATSAYSDGTSLGGRLDFTDAEGKLYATKLSRDAVIPSLPGREVAQLDDQEMELGRSILDFQNANQDINTKILNGEITGLVVDNLSQNGDSTVLDVTCQFSDGKTQAGNIEMVFLNGFWYIKGITVNQ